MKKHVSVIYIKADPDTVWEGITSAEFTRRYFHNTDIESNWGPGDEVTFYNQDRTIAVTGQILEASKPARLSYSWQVHYNPDAAKESPSRVTFILEPVEDATRLTLIHDEFPDGSVLPEQINAGWPAILSNLKTLLETDEVMAVS
ncbi:MAG: SRPBCC family protein [Pseudomonadales bacterium]